MMNINAERSFTRRDFLRGGGALIIGASLPSLLSPRDAVAQASQTWPSVNPSSLDSWLAVHPDGTITAFSGKVELGMGNRTAFSQIIAEELDVPLERIRLIVGDTARCVDQGITADSSAIERGGPQIRQAAADGRQALLDLAAARFGVPTSSLTTANGVVSVVQSPSQQVSYGELVGGQSFGVTMPTTIQRGGPANGAFTLGGATPKPVSQYTIVGKPTPRIDIPGKVTGEYVFIQDVRFPGMLHGRVIRPTGLGSHLLSVGKPPPGVQVVRLNDFLGVVAEREWDAIKAQKTLEVHWSDWAGLPAEGNLDSYILATHTTGSQLAANVGNVDAALASAAHTFSAQYTTPIQTHGALGPSCAVADVRDGSALIWSGTQWPNGVKGAVANALRIPAENVRVITYDASGCYGRNGADPATVDAALMSQLTGRPVRVQWSRADEHGWDPKGPATVHQLQGGLDSGGNIVAWDHQDWLPNWFETTIIGSVLAGRTTRLPAFDLWDPPMDYTSLPAYRLTAHFEGDIGSAENNGVGLISAWLRSPVQLQTQFARESFLDELAAAAGADPVELRLRYLQDQRMINVLKTAARAAGWQTRPSPGPDARSSATIARGRGIAISKRVGTYNASVAEVEVNRKTGKITVTKMIAVQDNGLTINPSALKVGIEAGVVQTVSRTLIEEATFNRSNITSLDWVTYPVIRFKDAPPVEVILIKNPDLPATGAGEPMVNPVAPSIGNAVFDATGVRLRSLPMRPDRVRPAFA